VASGEVIIHPVFSDLSLSRDDCIGDADVTHNRVSLPFRNLYMVSDGVDGTDTAEGAAEGV